MQVTLSDFQVKLMIKAVSSFMAGIPLPVNEGPNLNAVDETFLIIREEAATLIHLLHEPGDLTPKNSFRQTA